MRDLLTYELGPIPWANGKACGSLNQTTKAVLPTNLENEDAVMESKPNVTACIIDIMGVIQVLQHILETFGRMADKLLSNILEYAGTAVRSEWTSLETDIQMLSHSWDKQFHLQKT